MVSEKGKLCVALWVLIVVATTAIPAFGGSAVVGSVAGSMNATISGQAPVPNTTIFSRDSLQVKEGAAVVAVGSGSRLVFGRETEVSFLRDANEVTVLLGQGNVSLYRSAEGTGLRVKVGEVSILPAAAMCKHGPARSPFLPRHLIRGLGSPAAVFASLLLAVRRGAHFARFLWLAGPTRSQSETDLEA